MAAVMSAQSAVPVLSTDGLSGALYVLPQRSGVFCVSCLTDLTRLSVWCLDKSSSLQPIEHLKSPNQSLALAICVACVEQEKAFMSMRI